MRKNWLKVPEVAIFPYQQPKHGEVLNTNCGVRTVGTCTVFSTNRQKAMNFPSCRKTI